MAGGGVAPHLDAAGVFFSSEPFGVLGFPGLVGLLCCFLVVAVGAGCLEVVWVVVCGRVDVVYFGGESLTACVLQLAGVVVSLEDFVSDGGPVGWEWSCSP